MPQQPSTDQSLRAENAELRARLEEAEEKLRAIRAGEVDALVVECDAGPRLLTLQGLDAEQNRLRGEMLAQVSDAVIAVDNEERVTFLNAAAERQYGVRAVDVLGRKLTEIFTGHWPSPEEEAAAGAALRKHGQWHGEYLQRTHQGRELQVDSSMTLLRDSQGEIIGRLSAIRDITARRAAEEELRYREQLHRVAFDQAPTGMVFAGLDGRFIRVNARMCEITGYSAEELVRMKISDLTHPEDRESDAPRVEFFLSGGTPQYENEKRYVCKGGIIRWVAVTARMVTDSAGQPLHTLGVLRDITDRKEAEERLRLAIAGSDLGTWHWDIRTGALDWSERCLKIFGLPPRTTMSYEKFLGVLHPEDRARADDSVQRALQDGLEYRIEFRSVWPDGSVHWAVSLGRAYYDAAGEPTRMEGIALDITERKCAEAALRLTHERLTLAVKCSQVVLWQQDLELRYTWLQNAVSGFEDPVAIGKRDADLMERAADAALVEALKREVIRSGISQRQEVLVQIAGAGRHYDLLVEPQLDAAGLISGVTCAAIDITGRKQAEESRRLLASIVETSRDFIGISDTHGNPIYGNRAAMELVGVKDLDQVRRSKIIDYFILEQRPFVEEVVLPAVATDGRWSGELTMQHFVTGAKIPVRYDLFRVDDPVTGQPVNFATITRDLTESKRVEKALADRTELLNGVLEGTSDVIFVKDLDGRCLMANAACAAVLSSTPEQMVGKTTEELCPPDLAAAIRQHDKAVIAGGSPVQREETFLVAGEARVFLTLKAPLRDGSRRVLGILGISRDITERKRVEQALADRTELLNGVLESTTDVIFVKDLNGRMVLVNAAFAAAARSTPQQLVGKTDEDWFPPEVAAAVRQQDEAVLAGGSPMQFEETVPVAGEPRVFLTLKAPLRDGGGRVVGILGISRDITERKQAEQRLKESEERVRLALDGADMGSWDVDLRTGRATWNRRHALMQGCEASDEPHTMAQWRDRVHPDDLEQVLACAEKAKRDQTPFNVEHRVCLPQGGEPRWLSLYGRFTYDEAGEPVRFSGVSLDITEGKQAEAALRESGERLQRWNEELEQAVNVKTAELLQSQDRLRGLATELNLTEQRERQRMATELHDHLQQMLILGKLTIGQGKRFVVGLPACEQVLIKVDDVLSEALTYTRTLVSELSPPVLRDHGLGAGIKWLAEYMKKHEVAVTVSLPDEEVKLPDDQVVLLFQSIRELLINSSKHAGTHEATVDIEQQNGQLTIEVKDKGAGFDLAAAAAAADTPNGGLSSKFGLFSVRERMKALGGRFDLRSTPGEGTTATLVLPLRSSAECSVRSLELSGSNSALTAQDSALPSNSALSTQHSTLPQQDARIRVLLVDDHAMVRRGLCTVLDAYEDVEVVGEASDGEEALAEVERLRPNVVLMDINMPRKNGIEATAAIKARHPGMVVIGLSVNSGGENELAMRNAGAAMLLTKEAAVEELYKAIRESLDVRLKGKVL